MPIRSMRCGTAFISMWILNCWIEKNVGGGWLLRERVNWWVRQSRGRLCNIHDDKFNTTNGKRGRRMWSANGKAIIIKTFLRLMIIDSAAIWQYYILFNVNVSNLSCERQIKILGREMPPEFMVWSTHKVLVPADSFWCINQWIDGWNRVINDNWNIVICNRATHSDRPSATIVLHDDMTSIPEEDDGTHM